MIALKPRVVFAGLAFALGTTGAIPLAFAQSNSPHPHYVDETDLFVHLVDGSGDPGVYRFHVSATVFDHIGPHDAVRIDWKQHGRVIANQRCRIDRDDDGAAGRIDCELEGNGIDAYGPVDADLVYLDDDTDTAQVIRTLHLRVGRYFSWEGMNGRRPLHRTHYQIIGDDLLGTAFVYETSRAGTSSGVFGQLRFYFWTSSAQTPSIRDATLRCSVNGQRVGDFSMSDGPNDFEAENRVYTNHAPQDSEVERWHWNHYGLIAAHLYWGTRADVESSLLHNPLQEGAVALGDHAGAWTCDWRVEGQMVRQFRFNVDANGHVLPHPEQAGPNGLHLWSTVAMVDVRFPRPNRFDFSFQPAAIRASSSYGRPWVHPEAMAESFATLPPAVGRSEPRTVPAGVPASRGRAARR